MTKKIKIILSVAIIVSTFVIFISGVFIGSRTEMFDNQKHKYDKYILFYSSKNSDNAKKKMSDTEKKVLKAFIASHEKCIRNKLNEKEKKMLKDIEKEVLEMSKNNTKIKFRISDLNTFKNDNKNVKKAVSKVRKCLKNTYKNFSKREKKELRLSLSKLSIDNIISIFHGIR